MKTHKKIWAVLLSVLLTLTMCAAFSGLAFAEDPPAVVGSGECGAEGGNLTWTLTDDGVLTISGTGAMADFGESYRLDENHEKVYDNENESYVMIRNDDAPWQSLNNLDEMAILAQMGYASTAEAEEAVRNGTFDWDAYSGYLMAAELNATAVGHKVVIGEGVTTVGANAFKEWTVTEVTLPSTLKELGYYAFEGNHFTSVTLPEGLEYIGEYAIANCNELESIVIPASVTKIDSYAIGGYRLADITVLNPELGNYDLGYITVLGAENGSFPLASVEDFEFFADVRELVSLYKFAKYDYAAQLQSASDYYAQLVAQGQMTQEQADAYLNNYRVQFSFQLKMLLRDASIQTPEDAVPVICNRLNTLLATQFAEADLLEIYDVPLYGGDSPETYKEARLAAAADAVLTQKLGHGFVEIYNAYITTHSIAHYCNNPETSLYTPAPWIRISGYCGSPFEAYVSTRFPFTKLHDFTNAPVTTEPGCETEGEKTFVCPTCEQTVTEAVPALGHDIIEHEAKAPTATQAGWNAYETCSRCDYSTYEELPATGEEEPAEDEVCVCGKVHKGFFGKFIMFFHKIVYFFKNLFKK